MSKNLIPVILVFSFAILRIVLYYNNLLGREVYFKYDEAIYAMLSQRFLSGDFLSAFHPYWNSGFSIATIPFYLATGSWEAAQILVSMTSHILLIFVMYLTLQKISNLLALTVAFLTAFSPSFSKLVLSQGVTEPIYVLLFWLAIYFGWQALTTRRTSFFATSGLFFGLAYFTRTEVIYTLTFFLLFAILSFILCVREKWSLKIFTNKITLFGIFGAIVAYLYIPLTKLSKFTTFGFQMFRSIRGLFFALIFLLIALVGMIFERNKENLLLVSRLLVIKIGLLFIVFLFVNLPYIIIISKNLRHPTLSGKYSYVGSAHPFTPEKNSLTTWAQDIWSIDFPNYESPYYDSSRVLPLVWKNLDNSLEAAWKRIWTNLSLFAYNNIFTNAEALLTLLGIILGILQPKFAPFIFYLLVLWFGSFLSISYFMDSAGRYLAFSFPIFYIFQAFAVFSLGRILSRINPGFLPLTIISFFLFFFFKNIDTRGFYQIQKSGGYSDQKQIGDWLKSQNIDLIMARTEGIEFYADAKMVYMPAANPPTIIKFAKAWGAEYLVARPTESSWDYMRPIVNPNFNHPDLILKHQFGDGTLIWKVKLTEEEKIHNFRTTEDINRKFEDININSQIKL